MLDACHTASLGWLAYFTHSVEDPYYFFRTDEEYQLRGLLMIFKDVKKLQQLLLSHIKVAVENGKLLEHKCLPILLETWVNIAKDNGSAVRAWTTEILKNDDSFKKFVHTFTYSNNLTTVQRKVKIEAILKFVNKAIFDRRAEEVAATDPEIKAWLELAKHAE